MDKDWALPVTVGDLAVFAARKHLASGRPQEAQRVLERVCDAGAGAGEAREILAGMLLRQGVAGLREGSFAVAREWFIQAREMLRSGAEAEVS